MGMENRALTINNTLKSLCTSNGWSYGVFWRFDPRNHMLLTMEDAYFDTHVESVVNSMLPGHMLGEGKIGHAAHDGKHRWMLLDALTEECKTKGHFTSWDDSEFGTQLLFGIKTVAVIPVESRGVLQFGSTKEISETPAFLDQARKFLLDEENFVGVAPGGRASSSFNSDYTDLNGLFASTTSSQNSFYDYLSTSWESFSETMRSCSTIDSLPFAKTIDGGARDWCGSGELTSNPNLGSLVNNSICDDRPSNLMDTFEPLQFPASFFDPCEIDDLSQWLPDSSNLCLTGLETMVSNDMSHTLEVDCRSSGLGGSDIFPGIQAKQYADSSYSSPSNASKSGKCLLAPLDNAQLLAEFGIDFESQKLGGCWEDIMSVVGNEGGSLPVQTGSGISISECISGTEGGSAAPRKGLFSELGLEHLLSDSPCNSTITKSCLDDEWPTKRRRIENNQAVISKEMQLSCHSTGAKWMQPASSGGLKECKPKSQTGLWIDDCCSMDAKSCMISGNNTQTRSSEEPVKTTKKRAKPGESTRPRPKDRQMIADRIKELRDIIPDGAKLSIDALLGRTVKHMLFMQSLAKHADKLKQVDKPKLIGKDDDLVQNGNTSTSTSCGGNRSRGATWAYEVGGKNLFCPIIVEDLDHPGQMLIEMLCEERGYLLEIADIVRDLGLTILKGVMEARDDKIWAHFIVEGNKHVSVTRMEVFVSLMQLLQGTSTSSGGNKNIEAAVKVGNDEAHLASLWSNYQQHQVVTLAI